MLNIFNARTHTPKTKIALIRYHTIKCVISKNSNELTKREAIITILIILAIRKTENVNKKRTSLFLMLKSLVRSIRQVKK